MSGLPKFIHVYNQAGKLFTAKVKEVWKPRSNWKGLFVRTRKGKPAFILIRKNMRFAEKLITIVHEGLHFAFDRNPLNLKYLDDIEETICETLDEPLTKIFLDLLDSILKTRKRARKEIRSELSKRK